ncbi:MAG: hypothetical protein HY519_02880 [Candidatus Aenigmarchaeota archaeon]|nr:hypothetical protein [Candidatus Aenigmarchaeota archaeon]
MHGQAGMEFILFFGFALVMLTIAAIASQQKTDEVLVARQSLDASVLLAEAKGKIDVVYLEGHGFSINFTLPDKLGAADYEINISSNIIYVSYLGNYYQDRLLTAAVYGTLRKGSNLASNVNGTVVLG